MVVIILTEQCYLLIGSRGGMSPPIPVMGSGEGL